ncbi:aspartyl-tRNA synthetase [Burkholderia sp. BCC1977]|uniref:aspartyl-tRNA synthetase n=1 Tax=Burkholderia sp. BCC1977 TaxID=2817440 RepID=UPI002ABE537A|nr:aspartyl-tRNA synthetase [Burkholderia sp. BCC1977]
MNEASETDDSVWRVDPVAGTVIGALPMVLPVDSPSFRRKAIICAVLAGLVACGYAADLTLWPVAALAVLLALISGGFFFVSRRELALHLDETGFGLIGSVREKPVTPWRDVSEFGIVSIAGNRYIGYQFSPHSPRAKVPGGVMLPINRFAGLPLDAVAVLLETCRRQFGMPDDRVGRTD